MAEKQQEERDGCCRLSIAAAQVLDRLGLMSRTGPSKARNELGERSSTGDTETGETIFYLAYGSNLSAETFLGKRGIKPLSQLNVAVPELKLTFDLPGVPYSEPCFANTAKRDVDADHHRSYLEHVRTSRSEKQALNVYKDPDHYHKDRWHKPLVGVLYGLTPADYVHVIATEGGGASYQDIIVACYPLDPTTSTVPMHPSTTPVKGHTLFAPAQSAPNPGDPPPKNGRFQRPDPAYAQPSERYKKLITDGAREHDLPAEYREYLAALRPYRVKSQKQRLGQFVFTAIWTPIIMIIFSLMRMTADEDGKIPKWLAELLRAVFAAVWVSYDQVFKDTFGDGERTEGE